MKSISSYDLLEDLGRVRLSRSFFMRDFLHSEIAAWHGLNNAPEDPDAAIAVGRRLCETLLEPLQDAFGRIHVRSGYRSPTVNAHGNKNKLNCASNEANFAAHIWDRQDASGHRGATACIVVPWLVDHVEQGGDWTSMAWWIHDHLPYSHLTFFPKLCAFNIGWHEAPQRRIDSYVPPKGCLTKPGMPNHGGLHSAHYLGFPPAKPSTASPRASASPTPSQKRSGTMAEVHIDERGTAVPPPIVIPPVAAASRPVSGAAPTPKIFYRAVHSRTRWRKAHNHRSLEAAIHGKDGAAGLFAGRVRIDYATHGDPLFVLAWEDGASSARLVRPEASNPQRVRVAQLPIEKALEYERRQGASIEELKRHFD